MLRAVGDDMGTGMAAAAYVRVAAVTASTAGGLVEVEAHCLGSAQFSLSILSFIESCAAMKDRKISASRSINYILLA